MVRFALMGLLLLTPVVALTPLVWHCVSQPAHGVADDGSIARRRGTGEAGRVGVWGQKGA
jgi:hypothetical protein